MSVPEPCVGCGAVIDCPPDSDYVYTLTGDPTLPFFFLCPAGYSCQPGPGDVHPIFLSCCSHILQRTYTSQTTDAQLSALVQDMLNECQQYKGECADPPTGPGDGPGPTINPKNVYFSEAVQCHAICPDGSGFLYTLPAGWAMGMSQFAANNLAMVICRQRADILKVCPPSPSPCFTNGSTMPTGASGSSYFQTLLPIPPHQVGWVYTYNVTVGSLPPGLNLNGDTISGIPTTPGTYVFTVTLNEVFSPPP
jgi:hypothetical protein